MKFLSRAQKSISFWFILVTSFIFFLLRLPSLFEPYWYGDEGIYQVLGIAIRHGRLLYREIWDNKPPLLYLLYALFNSDQFTIRLVSLIFGILSTIVFLFIAKNLFNNNKKPVFLSTGIFAFLFALPLIEGNIANAENFMLLPILLAGFLILKTQKKSKTFISGLLVSAAFLFKIVAVFDFAAFFLFLLFINAPHDLSIKDFKNLKKFIVNETKKLLPFIIGFISPILLTSLFFLSQGAIKDFISASFVQNVGYVGYGNKFIIPQGFLILKLILLSSFSLLIFLKREHFSKAFVFISLWFAFSLFNAFFSGRPYTHYVLVLLPSFCLLIGLIINEAKLRKFTLLLFLISLFLILKNFNFYGKTIFYYQNFTSFITANKSVVSYRGFFDGKTPRDYEIVNFIKSHTNSLDNIFLWGNDAQIYAMANKLPPGRYAVAYHITGYKDGTQNTKDGIEKSNPKFIIIMPDVGPMPFSVVGYKETADIGGILIYERIF